MSDAQEKQERKYKSKNLMGYIQDKVDVGMTKLRSDECVGLDVAILKATLQTEVVPKEKHVTNLKAGCAATAPRTQVNRIINGLVRRLEDKPGWLVTLKTLIVFHRLMREVDVSFQEELLRYQERTGCHRMLRLEAFADHTTKDTWDYSAWIRVYSVYLDERLGCFKSMKFDPELDTTGHGHGGAGTAAAGETKLKTCGSAELLDRLPQVQKLLNRLIACMPDGASLTNDIILQSCVMVLSELKATYKVVCEGMINLTDKFFEMERPDALRALDIYKENMMLNEKLNTFFNAINNVPALKGQVSFPALQALPADFLTTMEEYVKDAPKVLDATSTGAGSGSGPTNTLRTSTVLRQSGTTSPAMAGTETAPTEGVLKIGAPTGDPATAAAAAAPAAPTSAAQEIDLLGDAFDAPPPAPANGAAPAGNAFGESAFGAGGAPDQFGGVAGGQQPGAFAPPPGAVPPPLQVPFNQGGSVPGYPSPVLPTPSPMPGSAPGGFNPFASPPMTSSPVQLQQGGYAPQMTGMPPQMYPGGPYAGPTGGPYGGPTGGMMHPGMQMPMQAGPYAGPTGGMPPPPMGYGAPTYSNPGYPGAAMPSPAGSNPFGGAAGPVWGSGPPQGASGWNTQNVVPGNAHMKRSQDPLKDLGVDLFGKPNQQPPTQSLRDMKLQG